uniref:Dermacentor 9 kDa family member n=1 Tax=Rhipicephalus appendiculatus TaxID=34631 RepID=A0A131Z7H2_RHIAP
MNGKCVAYCSLLVFAVLIKTTAEPNPPPEPKPGNGISMAGAVQEFLDSNDQNKQSKNKGSSNPRCNTKDQQHYCVTAIRENCTCADIKRPCSAEGLECPNRKTPQCYQRKTGSGITPEISCSCSCL